MRNHPTGLALLLTLISAWPAGAGPTPGESFTDCAEHCPEMVVVPAGTFRMGSTEAETTREGVPNKYAVWEKPVHTVTIGKPFAVGKYAVTWDEFNAFAKATGFEGKGCYYWNAEDKKVEYGKERDWEEPGFAQTALNQPAVCVSWDDARKYTAWLSERTGQPYRLLSEAEWEYAARAGTATARYWGDAIGAGNTNCGNCGSEWDNKRTAPSGSFKPNPFGLYDMLGNAWQWTADCRNDSYTGAPSAGSVNAHGDCSIRVVRGGSWNYIPWFVRAAFRYRFDTGDRYCNVGFRVARTLP